MLHYMNWLYFDNLDTMGHPLGYRVGNVHRHISYFQDYARAVAELSPERTRLHKLVCSALDVDYKEFKPFEEDVVFGRPTYSICLNVLLSAVTEYLWTFTTIYEQKGYDYAKVLGMMGKYGLASADKYPSIPLNPKRELVGDRPVDWEAGDA